MTLIVYLSDWLLCGVRCLAVSPNFEIAKNNMAIALTDLGTKVADSFQFLEIVLDILEFLSFASFVLDFNFIHHVCLICSVVS